MMSLHAIAYKNRYETVLAFLEALDRYQEGACRACGIIHAGCEPDAENCECEICGQNAVDGCLTLAI